MEEALRQTTGSTLLLGPRNAVANLVMLGALLCFPALVLVPRLPIALLLPLALTTLWLNTGAAPLPLMVDSPESLAFACIGIQLATAAGAFGWIRHASGGWWLDAASLSGPAVSLRRSALRLAGMTLLLPVAAVYAVLSVAVSLESVTRGFVSFDLSGVSLADRRYQRGDNVVRLVGMMHIGERDAYGRLVQSFVEESTVVLEEGVTDHEEALETPLSYDRAAAALGLEQQESLQAYLVEDDEEASLPEWPVFRHADLDVSDFDPTTVEWMGWMAELYDSHGPVNAIVQLSERIRDGGAEWAKVENDILTRRNDHLLAELHAALPEYRNVVVPWGALHLPAIEAELLADGFEPGAQDALQLISWSTLLDRLRSPARGGDHPTP